MNLAVEILFWGCLAIVIYSYVGYGIVLYLLVKLKRVLKPVVSQNLTSSFEPPVTILIAAYNEIDFIKNKIENTLSLDYPAEKISYIIVTDGSDDGTDNIVLQYPQIKLLHQQQRQGKIAAVNRAMTSVATPFVVFTDANTLLNQQAIKLIIRHFGDSKVGAVAGEKRIITKDKDAASGAGEGFYWKYESALKRWDSELYSVVGAAGELFAIRTPLFEHVPADTIIEDFYLTLRIAQNGHKVVYEPEAFAMESASSSVKEELKRKIRIANGGIQAIVRLRDLLNPFKYGVLSFQYISHRVLRWTMAPLALPVVFLANLFLALQQQPLYMVFFILQVVFYLGVGFGQILENKRIKIKIFFIPYYFFMMNYAVFLGFIRYVKGTQTVLWEKAKRDI